MYNAIKVVVEFRFGTPTTDNGTGTLERLYVGQTYETALFDILNIIAKDDSVRAEDIGRITAEPRDHRPEPAPLLPPVV